MAGVALAAGRPGVVLLDVHSDADHHRSVLTFAGDLPALVDGLVAATREAAGRIDLRSHEGVHPRLGAMDVVPFVPTAWSTRGMQGAVEAARSYAERIATELGIPSFLYGEAAGGRPLPDLRRRAFHDLAPDFGGPGPHPSAGATAVGARGVLVAYNVELGTPDLGIARRIARAIRERDGGLPFVRALGLALPRRGRVQVSTNLVRPDVTPMSTVFDTVAALAAAEGVEPMGSEIVGLVPAAALGSPTARLRLGAPPKVLEEELARAFPSLASDAAVEQP